MSLQEKIYALVKKEITEDTQGIGYKDCKNDAEIMDKLNTNPVTIVSYISIGVTPMSRIMQGVAEAPNVISKEEVSAAKISTAVIGE
jgi:hypothetical protein